MKAIEDAKAMIEAWGAEYPWVIFLALVILPGFGFPASFLLVLAGVVWGPTPGSCLLAMLAVTMNISWTHLAASGVARPLVTRMLGNRWQRWQNLPKQELRRLTWVLRVTPGMPLCVQNYLLSLLGVPFWYSVLVALPLTGLYVAGFILTGGAIFEGNVGLLITGISVLVVATVVIKSIRARQNRRMANPS
ncbi:SNARE-associated Golgi protein [Haloferula helveola]|uniref:SNARE-associated Golgi protein n=1 Tax=Haloferula helveola TaxID=490095 RepID=A0ABM7RDV2_9BACT|nr:SNARE-associated Golgi protein [Haloferula helveola]